jgi:hypothetical protein
VFSPDGGIGLKASRGQAKPQAVTQANAALEAEMQNLDRVYASAQDKIESQKRNAVNWILRQKARMGIQLNGIVADRGLMAPLLDREREEYEKFYDHCWAALEAEDGAGVEVGRGGEGMFEEHLVND